MAQSDIDRPPPSFYASQQQAASSIGHSNAHAGAASIQQHPPRPSFHRPTSTVGVPTGNSGNSTGGDRYLAAAQAIELTQEEKQEGYYDSNLLQARPRNTAAAAHNSEGSRPSSPPPPTTPTARAAGLAANAVPYASRSRDDGSHPTSGLDRNASGSYRPARAVGAKVHLDDGGRGGGGGGVGRYPSRPPRDPRHGVRSTDDKTTSSSSRRTTARGGGRRRKQLKWWQKPKTFVLLIGLIILVGVGVGLGVGLTVGTNKENERSPGNPGGHLNPNGNDNESSGVQPSVSSAAAAATVQGARPSISLAARRSRIAMSPVRRGGGSSRTP